MRAAKIYVALVALAANVVACHLILGIGDEEFRAAAADAAPDSDLDATPAAPGRCPVGRLPPSPPATASGGAELGTLVLALSRAELAKTTDAGDPVGYDLDGKCTCDPRDNSINADTPTCIPPADAGPQCDEDGGVDNAFAQAFGAFSSGVAQQLGIDPSDPTDLKCGTQTILLILVGYNGEANDPEVAVGVTPSYGIRDAPDGGVDEAGAEDAGCKLAEGGTYPARFDGEDRWSHLPSAIDERGLPTKLVSGYVRDFQLSLDFRRDVASSEIRLPLAFGANVVNVATPILTGRLVPLDDDGTDLPLLDDGGVSKRANRFRLTNGTVAGRTSTRDLLTSIGNLRSSKSSGKLFCTNDFYDLARNLVCSAADVPATPALDFKSASCDGLTIGLAFEATPARLGSTYQPTPTVDGGCADDKFECPAR